MQVIYVKLGQQLIVKHSKDEEHFEANSLVKRMASRRLINKSNRDNGGQTPDNNVTSGVKATGNGNGDKYDNKRDRIIRKVTGIHLDAVGKGFDKDKICKLLFDGFNDSRTKGFSGSDKRSPLKASTGDIKSRICRALFVFSLVTFATCLGTIIVAFNIQSLEDFSYVKEEFLESRCLINNEDVMMEVSRPLMKCSLCENLREIPIVRDISPEEFRERYAYSGIPVLVKGATVNWTAMTSFSFNFFKDLYHSIDGAIEAVEENCQFFRFKTNFASLEDAFNMSEARAAFQPGEDPWYIGWSNCEREPQMRLREYYERPYFLPNDSESSVIDWMFMGGSGLGALMHLDYVQRPSWQAQITGRKTWKMVPVPECESVCHNLNITLEKGDIFVVNTNVWYHETFVHPGEISIGIGTEYD